MSRTTVTAVQEILTTSLPVNQVKAFIEDSSLWVTEMLATLSPAPSAARLEIIERYLACAIIKLRELTGSSLKSVSIGDVKEEYSVPASVRDYLDAAAGFDESGTVRKHFLAPRPVASPSPLTYAAKFGFGTAFTDELPSDT